MAPSEQSILSQFLLAPAPLPTIITLQQFTALFPSSEQSSPEVKRLYRALQHRRALLTDAVTQDIDDEVKRGIAQKRAVVRTRRAAEREEYDEEVAVENAVSVFTESSPRFWGGKRCALIDDGK
jgi:centromere-localized protein 2